MSGELWDRAEPRALINIVPEVFADAMERAAKKRPDLFGLDEQSLYAKLSEEQRTPTQTDNRLRLKFWIEHDRAHEQQTDMILAYIFTGVCSRGFFYQGYISRPEHIAWLLTPPGAYDEALAEILNFAQMQARRILALPDVDEAGRPNVKLMELKVKILKMAEDRKLGGVSQNIVQRNMNLNVSTTASPAQLQRLTEANSMAEIEKRLLDLKKRDRMSPNPEGELHVPAEQKP